MKSLGLIGLTIVALSCGAAKHEEGRTSAQSTAEQEPAQGTDVEATTTPAELTETEATDGGSARLDYATCSSIARDASDQLSEATTGVPQCAVDTDCKGFTLDNVCLYRCFGFVGSDTYKEAIQNAFGGTICDEFYAGDCELYPVSCPPLPESKSYTCVDGVCNVEYVE